MSSPAAQAQQTQVDVVVVGLGPGGEAVATKLAQAGLRVVAVDQRLVGGECPYYGCIPTKMMIRAAQVLAEGRRIPDLAGASTVTPEWKPVHLRIRDEATADWNDEVAVRRLEDAGATFVRGTARLTGPRTVEVSPSQTSTGTSAAASAAASSGTSGGTTTFTASRGVVLNTGTEPTAPPIDGLADTPFWDNRDVVRLDDLPGSVIVIGGGAIGAESAQVFSRFGI
jgi:pyruvate/2-oxoglutarate dehydrogenase complex dihydrolipoamide dehydrogenase (E3) component